MELDNKLNNILNDIAEKVSKKANECCYRSDGYEEEIKKYVKKELKCLIKGISWNI